jgi:hypothetical protein
MMLRKAALVLVLAAATASAQEIYNWRDREGRTNYSDNPPADSTPARTLSGRSYEPPPMPELPQTDKAKPSSADQDLEFRKRQAEAGEKAAKQQRLAAEAEEKRRNCEQARNQLSALESGQRMARYNDRGEREYLDDAQRAEEIAHTRKAVDSWCK